MPFTMRPLTGRGQMAAMVLSADIMGLVVRSTTKAALDLSTVAADRNLSDWLSLCSQNLQTQMISHRCLPLHCVDRSCLFEIQRFRLAGINPGNFSIAVHGMYIFIRHVLVAHTAEFVTGRTRVRELLLRGNQIYV